MYDCLISAGVCPIIRIERRLTAEHYLTIIREHVKKHLGVAALLGGISFYVKSYLNE